MDFFLNKYPRMPLFEVGHSGIGKTMMPKAVARKNGAFYIRLNATGMEPSDCIGLPKITDELTTWRPPKLLKPLEGDGKWILILDEINRVPTETRHVLMQMLDERELGELKLGPNGLIVLTANPDDPGYQVDDLDVAFIRRTCVVPVEFHFDSFRTWGMTEYRSPKGRPISSRVLAAMERNKPSFVKEIKNREKFAQTPTADGAVRCSEIEEAGLYEYGFAQDEIIQILAGVVGNVVATSMVKDLNAEQLKKLKALIDNLNPLPENTNHAMQIDLLYYTWEEYGEDPTKNAKQIHHLFLQVNNDIKWIMIKMCHKYFSAAKTKVAFAPMKADWKKVCGELMLRSKGVDEEEVKALLNNL